MKSLLLTSVLALICAAAITQPLPRDLESTWQLQEGNEKIIEINYTLNRVDDNRYYKIIVRGFVDDRPIQMSSVGGDVGPAVRDGKSKTILWEWEKDVIDISGILKFVVTQDYTENAVRTPTTTEVPEDKSKSLPLLGHPGIYLGVPAGAGLAITGLLNSSSAKSDWDDETVRTSETYDPLNKKYKNGQVLSAVGGVVIVAGVVWYFVENAQFKKLSSSSHIKLEPGYVMTDMRGNNQRSGQLGLKFTYHF